MSKKKTIRKATYAEIVVIKGLLTGGSAEKHQLPKDIAADLATQNRTWRRHRQVAYWHAYEEKNGAPHPSVELDGIPKSFKVKLPEGFSWLDFGDKWDLSPLYPCEPILRESSVGQDWSGVLSSNVVA